MSAIAVEWPDGRVITVGRVGGVLTSRGEDGTRYADAPGGVASAAVSTAARGRCVATRAGRYQSSASVGRLLGSVRMHGLPLSWGEVQGRRQRALAAEGRVTRPDGPASW